MRLTILLAIITGIAAFAYYYNTSSPQRLLPYTETKVDTINNIISNDKWSYFEDSTIHIKTKVDITSNRSLSIVQSSVYKPPIDYNTNLYITTKTDTNYYNKPFRYVNEDTVFQYSYYYNFSKKVSSQSEQDSTFIFNLHMQDKLMENDVFFMII